MTATLAEQAERIAKILWKPNGGFIFCNKKISKFCTAADANTDHDNYAFVVDYNLDYTRSLTEKLINGMMQYCNNYNLEFAEK